VTVLVAVVGLGAIVAVTVAVPVPLEGLTVAHD
jgi:hypothetical protein